MTHRILLLIILVLSVLLWSISLNAAEEVVAPIIKETAERAGIDPELALAIAHVESNFNPNAIGSLGERGVFQLRPEFFGHPATIDQHVHVAIFYMKSFKGRCIAMYGEAWFICYNYGPYRKVQSPQKTAYYKKVMAAIQERAEQ